MPVWRLQTTWQLDSAFPKDGITITPHFNDAGALTSPDSLCEDLATALQTWVAATGQLTIRAYDAQGTVPVLPQGEAIRNAGAVMNLAQPRELAICLSFFNERNAARRRGRLYIPKALADNTSLGLRPSGAQQTKVAALAPIFANLGGADVDWCVYSRADDQARPVTNWYVDDEWDIVRSRGLRSTSRLSGTTTEA
jgi:hypothetical protein